MREQLVVFGLFSALTITGATRLNLRSNETFPERGKSLQLSCLTSGEFVENWINWRKPNDGILSRCYAKSPSCEDLPNDDRNSYSVKMDSKGAYVYINSLSREKDNGTWKCEYGDGIETVTINIYIYTSPVGVHHVPPLIPDKDLGVESLNLTCQTDSCCYPAPTIAWYYRTSTGQTALYQGPFGILLGNMATCTQSEVSYTSTLQLIRGTTFVNNVPVTTKFVCGMQHPSLKGVIIYSENSNDVTFAVNLTSITLKDSSGNNLPNTADLINGTRVTLICASSTSRPTATVNWYMENSRITSGINNLIRIVNNGLEYVESRLTLTPSSTDHHNKRIYCQAYTVNTNDVIQSAKSLMFVKVHVVGITLFIGSSAVVSSNFSVVDGTPTTLHCETTPSRPAAVIIWYKGDFVINNNVTTTNWTRNGLDIVRSSLTFTPSNSDHGQSIYCQAYNIDPVDKVTSIRTTLQVTGAPRILDISQVYKGYIGQYTMIKFGVYSNRDENLTVTAQHYNTSGLIQQGIIQKVLPDSLKMYSSPEPDFRALIAIIVRSEYDFGHYLVNVTNNVGSDLKIIRIDEQITPEKPINFHATNIQERQLSLMWQSGYHGRFPQTFVVETSQDNITWSNVSLVSDGNRDGWFTTVIENLNPGSRYYLRLYGLNKNGRGEFADEQLAVRMWKVESASVGVSVGGAVGIGVGGVVLGCIGAIITITIRRQLNGSKSSCYSSKGKTEDATPTYSNTEMTSQPVKPIYEELSKGNAEHNMYDKITHSTDGT